MPIRRVAVYARLSITRDESVSISRQLDSAHKYAEARGWDVVQVEVDDGVSATQNKPEDRPGWRALLTSPDQFDAVIIWKVDRLARRVLDFLHADEALQQRGAGIVTVEDPIDMTTAQGRAFATMLAVFGEMEAAAMSARVRSARRALVQAGRRVGGRPPFGFMNVPAPDGPGMILAHDPERIDVVRELARRASDGESIYSLRNWLEASGIRPRERRDRVSDRWHEAAVEAILRSPALAGMTPFTPGRKPGDRTVRVEVVRGADGSPIVDEELAIMTPAERRALLATLGERKAPGTRPRNGETALLGGIVRCGSCERALHRATAAGQSVYRCQNRDCSKPVGTVRAALDAYVADAFLTTAGQHPASAYEIEADEGAPALADIEAAIADTLARMPDDDADIPALAERLSTLKLARTRARAEVDAAPILVRHDLGMTMREAWVAAGDVSIRRDLLASVIRAVYLDPATVRGGRGLDTRRVRIEWNEGEVDPK